MNSRISFLKNYLGSVLRKEADYNQRFIYNWPTAFYDRFFDKPMYNARLNMISSPLSFEDVYAANLQRRDKRNQLQRTPNQVTSPTFVRPVQPVVQSPTPPINNQPSNVITGIEDRNRLMRELLNQ